MASNLFAGATSAKRAASTASVPVLTRGASRSQAWSNALPRAFTWPGP